MTALPLSSLFAALGIFAALQIPYLLLRRHLSGLLERLRYQLWALAVAGVAFYEFGGDELLPHLALQWILFAALVLTIEIGFRAVDRIWLAKAVDARGRPAVPQLVRDLGVWLVVSGAIFVGGWKILGWELGTWALPSAVISAVLGFALQDVLKNVFAGLALQTEAPFDVGDWLLVGNDPRQVLQMSWRSTHLRNNLSHNFREPNANLANVGITNLGSGRVPMGFEIPVGVAYSAPPALVKRSLERAARSCRCVVADPAPVGLVEGFGESAMLYRIRFWSRDVHQVARMLDEVRSRVWYQLHRDGWQIPYPIRTVEHRSAAELHAELEATQRAEVGQLLAKSDLFGGLSEEVRDRLAGAARRLYFDSGEKLVVEGETGDSLMLLADGSVSISKSGVDIGASTVALATLAAGAYFGEMSLLTGDPRSATVTAGGAVEVFVLDREAIAPILESDPTIAETLSQALAERTAATAARFEDRKGELARLVDTDRQSLLGRIRGFFRLEGTSAAK